jgi:hypothetical protein
MKTPKRITILAIVVLLFGVGGSIRYTALTNYLEVGLIISTITLVTVMLYVYYTYLIAKDAWTPTASFYFRQYDNDPQHIQYVMTNHSKLTLKTSGELTVNIGNKTFKWNGYYAKEKPWILQPLMTAFGHFEMKNVAAKVGLTLKDLEKQNKEIRFSFVLYYEALETGEKRKTEKHEYRFNSKNKELYLDV